jgi:hypothetical protein
MKNKPQFPEHNEQIGAEWRQAEPEASTVSLPEEQMFLDYLLEMGFTWQEAVKLVGLREHLYENAEMRQRLANDCRMHFARWLYEHGEIKEV